MNIALLTRDKYLYRKTELELEGLATVTDTVDVSTELIIYDCESKIALGDFSGRIIKLSRNEEKEAVRLPLRLGAMREMISEKESDTRLRLIPEKRAALLDGATVQLTAHEYSMLELLIKGGGELVPREEISHAIWGEVNDRLVNLYIHYLREKLEFSGEKIILSSRKQGYGINKKYLGGNG